MASVMPTTSSAPPHPYVSTPGGFDSLCICAGLHNCAGLMVSFALQRSPRVGLFSISAGASVVGRAHLHSVDHTSPSYRPNSAMRLLTSLSLLLALSPRHIAVTTVATNTKDHTATSTIYDELLRPAHTTCLHNLPAQPAHTNAHANSRALGTAQPCHRNLQAVNHTCTRHWHCHQGPGASPGTCQHCPVQQQRSLHVSAAHVLQATEMMFDLGCLDSKLISHVFYLAQATTLQNAISFAW